MTVNVFLRSWGNNFNDSKCLSHCLGYILNDSKCLSQNLGDLLNDWKCLSRNLGDILNDCKLMFVTKPRCLSQSLGVCHNA